MVAGVTFGRGAESDSFRRDEIQEISIRNARKWANDELKELLKEGLPEDLEKDAVETVQEMTTDNNSKIDRIVALKEKDVMTV